jgi:N-acetylglucosamine-6-phosphate deacetylase
VIDPANGIEAVADVLIAGGQVAAVGPDAGKDAREAIDARGLVVCPGFVKTPLTDRNTYVMPQLLSVERAAAMILRAVERGASEYFFPAPFAWVVKGLYYVPNVLFDRLNIHSMNRTKRRQ